MNLHKERCKEAVKILRPRPGQGYTLAHMAEVAAEAGYIREADGNLLLDAIDAELRGRPCYRLADVDALPVADGRPETPQAKRGPGRPPKAEGALVTAPPFRLHPADIALAERAALTHGEALGTFARRCFLAGLAQFTEEPF